MECLIDAWLHENLTVVQYQRFKQFMEGMSIREIARSEEKDYSSANESIKASQKKLKKSLKIPTSKYHLKSPYSENEGKEE